MTEFFPYFSNPFCFLILRSFRYRNYCLAKPLVFSYTICFFHKLWKHTPQIIYINKSLRIMVLIFDGIAHARSNLCFLICLRHLNRSRDQIGFFLLLRKDLYFHNACATCSELTSHMRAMLRIRAEITTVSNQNQMNNNEYIIHSGHKNRKQTYILF